MAAKYFGDKRKISQGFKYPTPGEKQTNHDDNNAQK